MEPARLLQQGGPGLRHRDEQPPADAVRDRRLTGRPRGLDDRPRRAQPGDDRPRLRRKDGRADAGRRPRQRHALLGDEHRDLLGAPLLDTTRISTGGGFFDVRGITIPVAVSTFPDEIYAAPRSWAERAYPKLIYYNKLDKGGHFAAWEQPKLFSAEMRAAFKSLRQAT